MVLSNFCKVFCRLTDEHSGCFQVTSTVFLSLSFFHPTLLREHHQACLPGRALWEVEGSTLCPPSSVPQHCPSLREPCSEGHVDTRHFSGTTSACRPSAHLEASPLGEILGVLLSHLPSYRFKGTLVHHLRELPCNPINHDPLNLGLFVPLR